MRNMERFAMFVGVLLGLCFLTACPGTPPVDALQAAEDALARALQAYANDCATAEFRAAERLLDQAREASELGDYDRALTLAQAAEDQAELARLTSQSNWDNCQAYRQALGLDQPTQPQTPPTRTTETTTLDGDYELVPVYFGFDASTLDAGARQTIANHAAVFRNGDYRIIVEGHCDHHGTEEYNLALGERRARSVKAHLVTMGVAQERIQVISYGEFRPASESDERLNRRAEFRIR